MHTNHIRLTDDDAGYIGPQKCSDYYGEYTAESVPNAFGGRNPLAVCGYTPEQLRFAYGVTQSGDRGEGITVAIVDAYASPTMLADVNRYAINHGERLLASPQYREVTPPAYRHLTDGECETPSSWAVEEALDVEAVHAMRIRPCSSGEGSGASASCSRAGTAARRTRRRSARPVRHGRRRSFRRRIRG